ncbi:MAG: AsmA-like C-terminal region-containing protein [Bacteroidales bacterium]|nr:AsmA-like C-terminal region-containing protein [Bacteroidales bacterium]
MKKTIKIIAIVLGFVLMAMIILPFAFKGKVAEIVQRQVDKKLNAKVAFNSLSLNFFSNFPDMTATLSDLTVAGIDSFAHDTLVSAKKVQFAIDWRTLITDHGISVKSIELDHPKVLAKVLSDGTANWDIVKPDTIPEAEEDTSASMHFEMEEVMMKHANVVYDDRQSKMKAVLKDWNGTFEGDLSTDITQLSTNSSIKALSFTMDDLPILSEATLETEISMEADLKQRKFTFLSNKILLNAMELSFEGWVQMPDTSTVDMDLKLNADQVTFKQFLSLIPALYMKDFESIKTSGNLTIAAFIKGKMQGENYPAFGLKIAVDNGMFQYPSLPKSVSQIRIKANISSVGGSLDNTKVDVSAFHFNMAGQPFDLTAYVATPMSDPDIKGTARGTINLGMVKQIYPLEKGTDLKGQIDANLSAAGRLSYLDKKQYEKFKANGNITVKDIDYKSSGLPTVSVKEAAMTFSPKDIALTAFSMKVGKNDIQATGKLNNMLAYYLKDDVLSGSLHVTSSYLNLNDFMTEDTTASTETASLVAFEIPKNLDISLNATGKEVLFSKLTMTNVQASLLLKNGRVSINNLSANALGGSIGVKGYYEALNPAKPQVSMGLDLKNVSFAQTFKTFQAIQSLAPIFENIQGNYSMNLNFNSALSKSFDPDFSTFAGSGLLMSSGVRVSDVKVLNVLAATLKNESLKTISTKDLKVQFKISEGKVYTSPFDINVGNLRMNLSGKTGLDKTIDYAVKVNLPQNMAVGHVSSLKGSIYGTFDNPKVKLDAADFAQQAVAGLADQLLGKTIGKNTAETVAKAKDDMIKQAEQIRAQAKETGEKLIEAAEKESQMLIEKANNPILKAAARLSASKLKAEAQKKADLLNAQADEKIKKMGM